MPEQVGALVPGPATDTQVARMVFGMVVSDTASGRMSRAAGTAEPWAPLPRYSTEDHAADAIIARFKRRFEYREIRDGSEWVAAFGFFAEKDGVPTIKIAVQVRAATRPLAICEAGLTLVDRLASGLA